MCIQLNPEIVVKERDVIPRICNWKVVALKPKFEMLMSSIFQENACSNIVPTPEELATIDLPEDEHVFPSSPTTSVNPKIDLANAVGIADYKVGVSVNESGHQVNVNAESITTDISTTEIVVRSDSKILAPKNRMPSRIILSPYLTSFASSEKGKEKMDDDVHMYFPFEGCGITYQDSSKLIDEYMQWLTKRLLKNHTNKDCGLYVAIFVEYLSDQIETSRVDFLPEYLRKIYGALLWSYGSKKAKGAYVNENDDPSKPKGVVTPPPKEDLVHIVL
ncbi:hypothetical protein H5410_006435 [Solanum commersonii]|uniref:Ulp1 protease family, C-terminal catalytic domain containing protein n=1 Tax=Solanum commersonii TaxID=4109 RepID=A0A9J6A9Q1_SOLCO|nr:hypothetical protein H5410_006435 [Solanum commersonii]